MELIGLSFAKPHGAAPINGGRGDKIAAFTIDGIYPDAADAAVPNNAAPNDSAGNSDAALPDTGDNAIPELIDDSLAPESPPFSFLPMATPAPIAEAGTPPPSGARVLFAENTSLPVRVNLEDVIAQRARTADAQSGDEMRNKGHADIMQTDTSEAALTLAKPVLPASQPSTDMPLPAMMANDRSRLQSQLPQAGESKSEGEGANGTAQSSSSSSALDTTVNFDDQFAKTAARNDNIAAKPTFTASDQAITDQNNAAADTMSAANIDPSPADIATKIERDTASQQNVSTSNMIALQPLTENFGTESFGLNTLQSAVSSAQSNQNAANMSPAFGQSSAPIMPDHTFADRIAQEITNITKTDGGISLQVTPERLGAINIEIMSGPNGDTVRLTAEDAEVRQIILQTQARIEQDMRQAGQKIASLEVTGGGTSDGSGQNQNMAQENLTRENSKRSDERDLEQRSYGSLDSDTGADGQILPTNRDNSQVRYA